MAETLQYGRSGDQVRALQALLNDLGGYGLSVDGKFSAKTQTAVLDYQNRKGLSADGIVGAGTWEALEQDLMQSRSGANQAGLGTPGADGRPTYAAPSWSVSEYAGFAAPEPVYAKGQEVLEAERALASHSQNAPGAYESPYADRIQQMLDDMLARPDFSYDAEADPFYQQYAQRYQTAGRRAMEDTMGQASALTGGYANSYAATAGQQAYQRYLQEMTDAVPSFAQNAYGRYAAEGEAMRDDLAMMRDMDDRAYAGYRDDVSDYYALLDYRTDRADALSQREYGRYLDELEAWRDERDVDYEHYLSELERWRDERDHGFDRYLAELAAWQNQRDYEYKVKQDALAAARQAASASSRGGGGSRRAKAETPAVLTGGKGGDTVAVTITPSAPRPLSDQDKKNIRKRQSAK